MANWNLIIHEFLLFFSRRTFGREREIQKHQRRVGPDPQRVARLLNNANQSCRIGRVRARTIIIHRHITSNPTTAKLIIILLFFFKFFLYPYFLNFTYTKTKKGNLQTASVQLLFILSILFILKYKHRNVKKRQRQRIFCDWNSLSASFSLFWHLNLWFLFFIFFSRSRIKRTFL